ncbi:MAG TPA: ABC transporter ATP-binding protein [Stackebrandtia sp.]|jgi:ABC-2 type transport system ATP-binding protein|uniref:ABC transporter ATP-binding protein n=1 Tax=Stackebrandtia sp. TaxID=2023065 RepID=UPI002D67ACFE|nr:ABC transporter ATP-binding protein [Stackebrandtia sp.]HZE38096.1 ABC transporter ATP-binding protein [Stackebrandtia sp.]
MNRPQPINVDGLECGYRGRRVLHGIDLSLDAGRIHAIVGLNGAGKTTVMRATLGMLRPDAGAVRVFGHPAVTAPARVWARIGYLIGTAFSYGELTGGENIYSAARLHGLSRTAAREATNEVITGFAIDTEAGRRVRTLSLGNRQRVALAAAVAHRPELLVLDEPTIGLDPLAVVRLRHMLRQLTAEHGAAVLVSSHHLDEVSRIADDITVIHRGRVIATIDPGDADLEKQFFDLVYAAELRGES